MHEYEVRPRKDKRGVDLISEALPFGRLCYGKSNLASKIVVPRLSVGICFALFLTAAAPLFAQQIHRFGAQPRTFEQPIIISQPSPTPTASTQITTGAVIVGTVTAFNPGLRNVEPRPPIVVQSSPDTKPVSYMLARKVLFEDKDGRAFSPRLVRPGSRVKLGFDRRGMVSRVIVVGETRTKP